MRMTVVTVMISGKIFSEKSEWEEYYHTSCNFRA